MHVENCTKPLLYLAGPLFSEAERNFNSNLKRELSPFFHVYLPQEDGGLLVDLISEGLTPPAAVNRVFTSDVRALKECDVFLIILDGRSVDEGAAFELGFAFAHNKPCYGFKTDPRQLLSTGNNPMIDSPLKAVFLNMRTLLEWAKSFWLEKGLTNPLLEENRPLST